MKSQYIKISTEIIEEIEKVIKDFDDTRLNELMEELLIKKRIFITGVGRTGMIMKSFAMRLMHLGLKVFVTGEINTPSINKDDLMIVGSGSGETSTVVALSEMAKKLGVKIVLFTINDSSTMGEIATTKITISATSPKLIKKNNFHSIQPMGALFEQSLMITLDTLIIMLMEKLKVKSEKMFENHANLE